MTCPLCGANWHATRVEDRPCLCAWTEPQREAVARLTHDAIERGRQLAYVELRTEREQYQAERDKALDLLRDLSSFTVDMPSSWWARLDALLREAS